MVSTRIGPKTGRLTRPLSALLNPLARGTSNSLALSPAALLGRTYRGLDIVGRKAAVFERRPSNQIFPTLPRHIRELRAMIRGDAPCYAPLLDDLITREVQLTRHVGQRLKVRDSTLKRRVFWGRFGGVHET